MSQKNSSHAIVHDRHAESTEDISPLVANLSLKEPPSRPTSSRAIVLIRHAESTEDVSSLISNFTLKELPLPDPLPEGSLLVKTLYLSNDPAQRLWMQKLGALQDEAQANIFATSVGEPLKAIALSRVVQAGGDSGSIKVGDIVEARTGWADYNVVKTNEVSRVIREIPGVSLTAFLGPLGLSGATAYFAFLDILQPKQTDTLVVSGAAGAVGNVAVQYAKNVLGVGRVVAIAGTDEKCAWLKKLGADEAVNYKNPTFSQDFAKATPNKVDKFFDNVGGVILDEVMGRMNPLGTIAGVGAISQYNKLAQPASLRYYVKIVLDRLTIKGFTILDYMHRIPEAEVALVGAAISGKLVLEGAETVVDIHGQLEEIPHVWLGILKGANTGKLITKVAD